jgi:hypothetical protein
MSLYLNNIKILKTYDIKLNDINLILDFVIDNNGLYNILYNILYIIY